MLTIQVVYRGMNFPFTFPFSPLNANHKLDFLAIFQDNLWVSTKMYINE